MRCFWAQSFFCWQNCQLAKFLMKLLFVQLSHCLNSQCPDETYSCIIFQCQFLQCVYQCIVIALNFNIFQQSSHSNSSAYWPFSQCNILNSQCIPTFIGYLARLPSLVNFKFTQSFRGAANEQNKNWSWQTSEFFGGPGKQANCKNATL